MDWDEPKAKSAQTFPRALTALGVQDLHTYVADLRDEITRVEAEISLRGAQQDAAEALFKRRD